MLVANRPGLAAGAIIDDHMINAWGIALRPPGAGGHIWISNAGTLSTSTYIGDARGVPLHQDGLKIVYLKGPLLSYEDGLANVTGQVYNAASDFPDQPIEFAVSGAASDLTSGTPRPIDVASGSAKFVFVTTEGTINAWRATTAASMDAAVIVKDYSDHGADQIAGAPHIPAFTGVAMSARAGAANRLYVTDFQNKTIRVIDAAWNDVTARVPFARPSECRRPSVRTISSCSEDGCTSLTQRSIRPRKNRPPTSRGRAPDMSSRTISTAISSRNSLTRDD